MSRCSALLAAIAFAIACSGASSSSGAPSGDFPADPYAVSKSDGGQLTIAVRTSPQPPVRGVSNVKLTLADPSGAPVDGVDVAVVLWMPSMGHGASVTPTVAPAPGGGFVLTNVDCFMPGQWEIHATFSGKVNDRATLALQIP